MTLKMNKQINLIHMNQVKKKFRNLMNVQKECKKVKKLNLQYKIKKTICKNIKYNYLIFTIELKQNSNLRTKKEQSFQKNTKSKETNNLNQKIMKRLIFYMTKLQIILKMQYKNNKKMKQKQHVIQIKQQQHINFKNGKKQYNTVIL
ncbi:hypothetical protein IMG5_068470 [Ichthyophthirius multifiliis]|uniref:Uncharacterized protein n=1 Tax=Ichthyophthirius multifiliis TaxID=5932 RepID=G0QPJ1_ICHMU|nr:hypothetical protein IMG5_068470 [Ichthyophthirius multifiliis]EGR32870.1 hypothetical protein IMG5_068470 [Ichthyophthirius multifiliis]|eukprot:XP_004036856.1 hypothetical protein IMG5_068470 [Ichthyophthirius multifiliis]